MVILMLKLLIIINRYNTFENSNHAHCSHFSLHCVFGQHRHREDTWSGQLFCHKDKTQVGEIYTGNVILYLAYMPCIDLQTSHHPNIAKIQQELVRTGFTFTHET